MFTLSIRSIIAIALAGVLSAGAAEACSGTVSKKSNIQPLAGSGVPKKGPQICEWTITLNADGCNIIDARLESAPPRGGAATTPLLGGVSGMSVSITREADGYLVPNRSVTPSGNGWYWEGNNLNCSSAGCGTSTYTIVTDTAQLRNICSQRLTLILTKI